MTQAPKTRRRRSKGFKFLIALLIAGGIGAVVFFNLKKEEPPETFATLAVDKGDLVDRLAETGSIELVRTVEVKSTISGELRDLFVEAGDWIAKDQLMAVIEPDPSQSLQLYQKRSAVEQARVNLQEQERDFERKKSLFQTKMIASIEYEDAQVRLARMRQNLRLAQLELEILEAKANLTSTDQQSAKNLDEVRVLAPIDGILIRRNVEIGEVVASGVSLSGGDVLFEIGDPSQMIVRADIAEIDIGQLRTGLEVDIVVDAFPDTSYQGQVRWIAPVGQKNQGSNIVTFDAEIDILDHEPRLRQGLSCDLDIIFSRRDSVLFLPVEAALEVFDHEETTTKTKGRRGRYIAYIVRPDTTATDSTAPTKSAAGSLTASPDSSAGAQPEPPDKFALDRFEEVELGIGMETSTRLEILAGLAADNRVAADPQLIQRKLEERQTKESQESDQDEN